MEVRSQRFGRTYQLDRAELIGEGNFAKVYKLYDDELKRYLAIRLVLKSESEMADILKERRINEELQKVTSSNILEIFEIIDTPQHVWYLTEYCAGGSLWDALNEVKNHKFSEVETLNCILQIAKGVQELHNHRITHRDLKPENILLVRKYAKGQPMPDLKIADFGLSTKNIIMETVAGTKEYIAPEQAKFQTYTNAVDVWSIGIIFDELLHGEPFYTGEQNKAVFQKIAKVDYHVRDETISEPIKQLLVSVLKKKAYERPIIGVLRTRLEEILNGMLRKDTPKMLDKPRSLVMDDGKIHKAFSVAQREMSAPKQPRQPKEPKQPREPKEQKEQKEFREPKLVKQSNDKVQLRSSTLASDPPAIGKGVFDLAELKQYKIPIYKCDKKRVFVGAKKNRREELSRLFVPMDEYRKQMLAERDLLRTQCLVLKDFTFNPNCKVAPFQIAYQPFERFTELKREFQYLNEIIYDEAYEIRILLTEHNLERATSTIKKEIAEARAEVARQFLGQVDAYCEELINKSIV